jgi:hypothetical protein
VQLGFFLSSADSGFGVHLSLTVGELLGEAQLHVDNWVHGGD